MPTKLVEQLEAAERAVFEKLIVKGGHGSVERIPGGEYIAFGPYIDRHIESAWQGWHARAQREAIEILTAPIMARCTCPSGDGSLAWPCPEHPPVAAPASQSCASCSWESGPLCPRCGEPFANAHGETAVDAHLYIPQEWMPPKEVVAAAELVGRYFAERNAPDWQLGPCRARFPAHNSVPKVKDHVLRAVINNLRDLAVQFHAAGQLRERLRGALGPLISGIEPSPATLTYMGESGEYEEIGVASGAGTMRGNLVHVYRDAKTDILYYRTPMEFAARMVRTSPGPASAAEIGKAIATQ
jgi:hypothetical protein